MPHQLKRVNYNNYMNEKSSKGGNSLSIVDQKASTTSSGHKLDNHLNFDHIPKNLKRPQQSPRLDILSSEEESFKPIRPNGVKELKSTDSLELYNPKQSDKSNIPSGLTEIQEYVGGNKKDVGKKNLKASANQDIEKA